MPKVLVVYDSVSGASEDVGRAVAEALVKRGWKASVRKAGEFSEKGGSLEGFDAVVIGCPLWLGRTTFSMRRFLRASREALAARPLALFFTCLTIPVEEGLAAPTIPVFIDPTLSGVDRSPGWLNFYEYFHTPHYAVKRFRKRYPELRPESVAFFNGRLDFSRLSFLRKAFMLVEMFMLEDIKEGDFVNRKSAALWAKNLFTGM
ncbi:MAG: hypothetical protein HZB23_09430 [Deltaproteobacteria bacterium]|nr:hypothetical protein [Deltaproteobacteria bacterium]